ncbi:hypothetical protein EPO04_02810 [Patescibacteria group bacterium]|nr:MAG: hypothetical protein EPO04_02810 [Patescibacteria group bacterium]
MSDEAETPVRRPLDLDELSRIANMLWNEGQSMEIDPGKILNLIEMSKQWLLLGAGVKIINASDVAQLSNNEKAIAEALAVFDDPPDMCPRDVRMAAAISAALRVAGFKHEDEPGDIPVQSSDPETPPTRKLLIDEELYRKLTAAGDAMARSLNSSPGIDVMRGLDIRAWNDAKSAVNQASARFP